MNSLWFHPRPCCISAPSNLCAVDISIAVRTCNFTVWSYGVLTLAPVGIAGAVLSALALRIGPMRRVAQTVWSR